MHTGAQLPRPRLRRHRGDWFSCNWTFLGASEGKAVGMSYQRYRRAPHRPQPPRAKLAATFGSAWQQRPRGQMQACAGTRGSVCGLRL